MKDKKGIIALISILILIIVVLLIYIVVGKSSDKKSDAESTTATATTEAATEKTDASTTDDADSVSESKDAEKKKSDSNEKKYACYAKLSDGGNWQNGKKYVYQFNIDIHNDSSDDLKDWEVRITGFEGGEIADNWNGTYEIKDDTLYITSVDYNQTLSKKSVTNMGLQVEFDSSEDGKKEKKAEVYIGGELYKEAREEPTTKSDKEKKESKKEKAEPESGTPLDNHGALSIKGTDIVDKNGDKYQLKGVSTHGIAWFPDYVNKEAFQTFRDEWGANLIRIAMYTGESGGYCQDGDKEKLKKLVSDGVDYATELGMYVIIDWHILSDNNPQTNKDEAIPFFDEMSAKYADYDNVLYEICNEPNGGTEWGDIKSYAEEVIPVIRANDKDAIIIVGTPTWSQDVEIAADDPITGQENIAYTVHFYAATHKDNIRDKVRAAHDAGLCVFISEFSICDASGNGAIDYDSADDWFDLIDEYNLSYAGWNISNKDESSALIDSGCDKTSGWTDDDLSETGIWLKNKVSE